MLSLTVRSLDNDLIFKHFDFTLLVQAFLFGFVDANFGIDRDVGAEGMFAFPDDDRHFLGNSDGALGDGLGDRSFATLDGNVDNVRFGSTGSDVGDFEDGFDNGGDLFTGGGHGRHGRDGRENAAVLVTFLGNVGANARFGAVFRLAIPHEPLGAGVADDRFAMALKESIVFHALWIVDVGVFRLGRGLPRMTTNTSLARGDFAIDATVLSLVGMIGERKRRSHVPGIRKFRRLRSQAFGIFYFLIIGVENFVPVDGALSVEILVDACYVLKAEEKTVITKVKGRRKVTITDAAFNEGVSVAVVANQR